MQIDFANSHWQGAGTFERRRPQFPWQLWLILKRQTSRKSEDLGAHYLPFVAAASHHSHSPHFSHLFSEAVAYRNITYVLHPLQ
jgi:hypothetical protein